jgi:putative transposase
MRYPAAEKLEIIRLVEGSHLPVRRTLARIGVPATTFYRWYDRYREVGPEGLQDRSPRPGRVWNRIPEPVRQRLLTLALEALELSAPSWPSASPTKRSISFLRLRSTACSRRTT